MSVRKSTTAIACAAAVTVGARAAAAPASATGTGSATYNCGMLGPSVSLKFSHYPPGPLAITTPFTSVAPTGSVVTSALDGVSPGPSGTVGLTPLTLTGPFALLSTAPRIVELTFTYTGTVLGSATCTYLTGSQSGSWPV
jgi:hypothetical protein